MGYIGLMVWLDRKQVTAALAAVICLVGNSRASTYEEWEIIIDGPSYPVAAKAVAHYQRGLMLLGYDRTDRREEALADFKYVLDIRDDNWDMNPEDAKAIREVKKKIKEMERYINREPAKQQVRR